MTSEAANGLQWPQYRLLLPNYNAWLVDRLRSWMGERLLEIGCGLGHYTEHLVDRPLLMVTETDPGYAATMQTRFGLLENVEVRQASVESENLLLLQEYGFDTIFCAHVLEHLADDDEALYRMGRMLSTGGRLLLVVAAFRVLFNRLDEGAGHLRRYDKHDAEAKLRKNGFSIVQSFYVNALGLLGWVLGGTLLRRQMPSRFQARLYNTLAKVSLRLEGCFELPLGLSLVCIAEKVAT
jgi:SAM-dependent methyltransferase